MPADGRSISMFLSYTLPLQVNALCKASLIDMVAPNCLASSISCQATIGYVLIRRTSR